MSTGTRRRRAFLLLSLALACGGLAASEVSSRMREVEAAVGTPVPVLVAARDLAPGHELAARDLELREVPERFAPPDALSTADELAGLPIAGPLSKGAYVTTGAFGDAGAAEGRRAGALRRGERAAEVTVAGAGSLGELAGPGSRVDVVVSVEAGAAAGRTLLALENVELLDLRSGGEAGTASAASGDGAGATGAATATLRVTLRQAVYLTAAQNFAREVRLLPRPLGDRGRAGRAVISASDL